MKRPAVLAWSVRGLSAVALSLFLSSCQLFGGGGGGPSAEETEGRVNMSVLDQKLAADAEQAAADVQLPEAVPAEAWTQSGSNASKLTPHFNVGSELKVAWGVSVGEGSSLIRRIVAPPVAANGRIYILDADQRVSAFATDNGRRIWTQKLTSSYRRDRTAIGGGVAISGDRLIVSSGYGYVVALSTADGSELWRRRTESPMSGAPTIVGGRAFLTSSNNELYCIDVASGEVVWTDQAIAETARILSAPSPAVADELLVAPYSSGELIAYVAPNGRRLWSDTLTTIGRFTPLSAINDIAGRPVIADGVVYAASHSGVVTAIDARSGQRLWSKLFGSRLGPVGAGEFLFIVGVNGQVVCLRKIDGAVVWVRDLPEYRDEAKKQDRIAWTGPLMASGGLFVVSSEGEALSLSPQTGETVGSLKVGQPVFIEPIAADGRIFVLTDKGRLIAIR
jgi:outer membrane protein assembly factor BamB